MRLTTSAVCPQTDVDEHLVLLQSQPPAHSKVDFLDAIKPQPKAWRMFMAARRGSL
jgi:hypothetical protein